MRCRWGSLIGVEGTVGSDGFSQRLWWEEPTLFLKFSGADKGSIEGDVRSVGGLSPPRRDFVSRESLTCEGNASCA